MKIRIAAATIILTITGCAKTTNSKDVIAPVGDSLAKSTVYVQQASADVQKAKPFTSGDGKIHLQNATEDLTGADKELSSARNDLTIARNTVGQMQTTLDKQATTIEAYRARWIGDKTFQYLRYIIAGWVVLGLVGSTATQFGGGWIGLAGKEIVRFLPLVNPFRWITGVVAWIRKPKD